MEKFEYKGLETKGLEGDALAFAEKYNESMRANFDALQKAMEAKGIDFTPIRDEMNKNVEDLKGLMSKETVSIAEFKSLENDLLKRINSATQNVIEVKTKESLVEKVITALQSLEIKSASDLSKLNGKIRDIEIKDAVLTTDMTGTIARTQQISEPKFAPTTPNAFFGVPGLGGGIVENGKSLIMWIPCTYTSAVGYVAENNAAGTDDAGVGQEKTREMAKISAKLPMSAETFEDLPQFAQRLVDQLLVKASYFVDSEIYSGDGNDATAKQHIYGIKTQGSTAFDYVTYGATYTKANILDLIDACSVQAELGNYKVNTVRLNPKRASELRRQKDSNGQPIVQQLVDGSPAIGGLRLITTSKIAYDEMLVSDDRLIQIWTKRSMNLKIGQIGTGDVEADRYTAILFARYQCLVEDADKVGVVYVANIDNAISGINKTGA
jgi:hypothetical protein